MLRGWEREIGRSLAVQNRAFLLWSGAVIGAIAMLRYGVSWRALLVACISIALVEIALVDQLTRLVPRRILYGWSSLFACEAGVAQLTAGHVVLSLSAVLCGTGSWLVLRLLKAIAPGSIGMGDVRLAALFGVGVGVVGISSVLFGWWIAVVSAGGYALAIRSRHRRERLVTHIAFAPFLGLGAMVALVIGPVATKWWLVHG